MQHKFLLGCAVSLLTACATPPIISPTPLPNLSGLWGGEHLELTLAASGGTLRYDCGAGTLDGVLKPDAQGKFTAMGTFTRGMGAVMADPALWPKPEPVTYSGQVQGETLRLQIQHQSGEVSDYQLQHDQPAKLVLCM
ncbi:MAG: hypothetical protein RI964_1505 [Pseudomonadota bacterium]|jgi:hypothetical protein